MRKLRFDDLTLSKTLQKAIADIGFEEATPIQSATIPLLFENKDIVGQAHTGTGKTAAFAIPIIEKIDMNLKEIQSLVLCPTRELAIQVTEEFRKLLKYKDEITAVSVYGGQDINRQLKALRKGPQILIGTPGRTIDHLKRGSINLNKVKIAVLDEADEMLDMGFKKDIEYILSSIPSERQTIMFSATIPKDFLELTKKFQKEPQFIDVTYQKINTPKIEQIYFELNENSKPEALSRLLDVYNIKLALVFCNTKNKVDLLVDLLKNRGYFAEGLHGDLNQSKRDLVMQSFRNGTIEVLVATDVAGRGLDINNVEAVFNFDLPYDDEDYVHRIGRTGRAGKNGKAFTFIVGKEIYNLKRIEKNYNLKIVSQKVPTVDELEDVKLQNYIDKIKTVIDEGKHHKYLNSIERIISDDYTSIDIAAALLNVIIMNEFEKFEKSIDFKEISEYDRNNDSKNNRKKKSNNRPGRKNSVNNRNNNKNNVLNRSKNRHKDHQNNNSNGDWRELVKDYSDNNYDRKEYRNRFKKKRK